jgi:hypothetical protein
MRFYTETLLKHSGLTDVKLEIDPKLWRPIDIMYQNRDATKVINEMN